MNPQPGSTLPSEQRLREVLAEFRAARAAGTGPSPDEWLARYPELAGQLRVYLAAEAGSDRPTLTLTGSSNPPGPAAPPPTLPSAGPVYATVSVREIAEYELLEEIARGGMGVVYRARHKTLHRVVALKMILADHLATPEQVRRFHTEAERAGSLDHAHIVPIYQVGEEQGRHYFTMKLVEGGRLSDHVPRLRANPREAARLMATVARAVHYAHERGILHRDLKPGNILVDAQGQPHITDFGLAKQLQGGGDETKSGSLIGTPSYMAPEQAAGHAHLTTAADVYGAGAILYELLTGQPPFQADNVFDVIVQVREKEPAKPSTLNPRLDGDLETICLTCLAKEPARRYPSALALAQDLERFLANEPIRARPAGYGERLLKWIRRRPAAAALLAVSCLAVLGLALLGWWHNLSLQDSLEETDRERLKAEANAMDARRQKQVAETNAALARRQRLRAETNAAQARRQKQAAEASARETKRQSDLVKASARKRLDVVDDLLIRLDGRLANYRGAETVRMEFLQEILKISRQLLDEQPTDPAVRRKTARVYYGIGDLWYDGNRYEEGDDAYKSALELQEALVKEFPKRPDYQNDLAFTLAHRGNLLQTQRRFGEARAHYGRAIGFWDRLAGERLPDRAEYLERSAYYCFKRGVLFETTGKPREATAGYRDALRRQEQLVAAYPNRAPSFTYLAGTATSLALVLGEAQPAEARRHWERALAGRRQALRLSPNSKTYQRNLRDGYGDLADFLKENKMHAELARLAVAFRGDFPDDANQTYNAACYLASAIPLVRAGEKLSEEERHRLADSYGTRAVDLLRKAVQEGYADRAHMDKDPDLDSVRQRKDYRELLTELDKRAPVQPLSPLKEYLALSQEVEAIQTRYQYDLKRAQTPAARKKVQAKAPRFATYAAKFLRLAEKHRDSPVAVEALFWILDNSVPERGKTMEPATVRVREKALQVLERDQFQKAELADVCQRLAETPMPDAARFLRTAADKHPLRDVRGLAGYALALSLARQADEVGDPSKQEELTAKAGKELERVMKDYASVLSGNTTLGEAAKAKLYELHHLTVGRAAPEIEGTDFKGKKFKLSDYRGQVVLLDFWANWCGFCRQMYPQERKLIQRHRGRPFVLLGVNCDDDKADVLREIKKEKLDWRSWWDGGPAGGRISKQWQVNTFPTIFVLDHRGVIRYRNLRGPRLDAAVDKLLREVPRTGR